MGWRLIVATAFGIACTLGVAWLTPLWLHYRVSKKTPVSMSTRCNDVQIGGSAVVIFATSHPAFDATHWRVDRGSSSVPDGVSLRSVLPGDFDTSLVTPLPSWAPSMQEPIEAVNASHIRFGWPFRALASHIAMSFRRNVSTVDWHVNQTIELPIGWPQSKSVVSLPRLVIWPGFAANVAIYGMLWSGIAAGAQVLRRAIRRKRNQCIHCRYDLRGCTSPYCPECGTPTLASTAVTDTRQTTHSSN